MTSFMIYLIKSGMFYPGYIQSSESSPMLFSNQFCSCTNNRGATNNNFGVIKSVKYCILLQTTLFLRQTLSRQKFLEVLTTRPSAVRHFVSYLTSRSELSELIDILSGLGRYNEAGLLIYKQALAATNGGNYDARAQRLKIITSQLHNHSDLAHVKGKI